MRCITPLVRALCAALCVRETLPCAPLVRPRKTLPCAPSCAQPRLGDLVRSCAPPCARMRSGGPCALPRCAHVSQKNLHRTRRSTRDLKMQTAIYICVYIYIYILCGSMLLTAPRGYCLDIMQNISTSHNISSGWTKITARPAGKSFLSNRVSHVVTPGAEKNKKCLQSTRFSTQVFLQCFCNFFLAFVACLLLV